MINIQSFFIDKEKNSCPSSFFSSFSSFTKNIENIELNLEKINLEHLNGIDLSNNNPKVIKKNTPIHTNFKLPISYLDSSTVFSLSPTVASDLELARLDSETSIYENLFLPTNSFGKNMIPLWVQKYTTNTDFLEDSQKVLSQMTDFFPNKNLTQNNDFEPFYPNNDTYVPKYDKIMEIWEDIKEDNSFLEKYGYLEWNILLHFNDSAPFLQCLTLANIISPIVSLLLPIIFIILPFIILKIQRIPIRFDVYLEVLKSIAKNHFIGKALMNCTSFSWDKIAYLIMLLSLYMLQIYQNISICHRFYRNIIKINNHLIELKQYVHYSIENMNKFSTIIRDKPTYKIFDNDLQKHCYSLEVLNDELKHIDPFDISFRKLNDIGYMLKCFYRIYSLKVYEDAIRYSVGFEGYIDNLIGVNRNINSGNINFATFSTNEKIKQKKRNNCIFKNQYYPPLVHENPVKNDCSFSKNIVISSPNKSGKTTILKTTAINIIFTQQLGCGYYSSGTLKPYSHIHSYLNIPDTSGRDSLFQAESRRCKDIIDIVDKFSDASKFQHFCIFDELYSGTNPEEATKAGYAFLKYMSDLENVDFILTTHYFKICKKFLKSSRVQNYKMDVQVLENGNLSYTYKMKKGISKIKGAIQVMKDMEYPQEIIDMMQLGKP